MLDVVAKLQGTEEYQLTKERLIDRNWRLDHLYQIKDEDGAVGIFKRKRAQRIYSAQMWYRDVIVKARQLGFSTLIDIMILDDCVFKPHTNAAIIDLTERDAKKKLAKCRFAYERLPPSVRNTVRLLRDNDTVLEFSNGSRIEAGTGFRGDTAQILHVSELGKISVQRPENAKEIKLGAFQAVHRNGKLYVESTGHGQSGEFYDLVQEARKAWEMGGELASKQFKLHFFPWFDEPTYRDDPRLVVLTKEEINYFEELQHKHGIKLDAEQRAFYHLKVREVGEDDIYSEFPSILDEAFFASLKGAYFREQMGAMRRSGRIGHVPFDPTRPVNTFHDLGVDDEHAIWFHQTDGLRHWMIDYAAASDEGLGFVIRTLEQKHEERGFRYGKHYGPHDLEVRDWSAKEAKPRWKLAEEQGVKFVVVPAPFNKGDAIEATRRFMSMLWIDQTNCDAGIKALDSYSKKWNQSIGAFSGDPLHNWASHPADALQTGVLGLDPEEKRARTKKRGNEPAGRTHWSS